MNRNKVGGLGHRTYSDRVLGVSLGWEAGFQAKTPETGEKKSHPKIQFLGTVKSPVYLGGVGSKEEESGQEEFEEPYRTGVPIAISPGKEFGFHLKFSGKVLKSFIQGTPQTYLYFK